MTPRSRPNAEVRISRRALLSAIGPACVATALAGCAADPTESQAPATSTPPEPADARESSVTPPESTDAVTDAPPQVLATTTSIPVGGGRVISGVLIVQPFDGLFKAFDARCPHLGALVSPPQGGVITCPQHNSRFVDIDGSLLDGPAPRGLKEIPIEVEGTSIIRV